MEKKIINMCAIVYKCNISKRHLSTTNEKERVTELIDEFEIIMSKEATSDGQLVVLDHDIVALECL